MNSSSEYSFPIFISSTDYNLKDLRAELARYLSELGYKPLLSSAEGFPDSSPNLEPWESCLRVLDTSFVVVLVIDGRYGAKLTWPNYPIFNNNSYSPTHAEYIFAHKKQKRMLVFIRKELMPHYQSFRKVLKVCGNNKTDAKKMLEPVLPEYVTFETLDFINEVKTSKPIPWITEFDDVTDIKKEVQKKMLNELAEIFLIKNKHLETVIGAFNDTLNSLSTEEQKKVLLNIHATKEIIETFDELSGYKEQIKETEKLLQELKEGSKTEKEELESKIRVLNEKISELEEESIEKSSNNFYVKDGQIKIGNPYNGLNLGTNFPNLFINKNTVTGSPYTSPFFSDTQPFSIFSNKKCSKCGNSNNGLGTSASISVSPSINLKHCIFCNKDYCQTCWPNTNLMCPSCQ